MPRPPHRAHAVLTVLAGSALLTGCAGPAPSAPEAVAPPGPSAPATTTAAPAPTTTAPPTTSSPPTAADGTNYDACRDNTCTVAVRSGVLVPTRPPLDITEVDGRNEQIAVATDDGALLRIGGSGGRGSTGDGGVAFEILGYTANTAILRIGPAAG